MKKPENVIEIFLHPGEYYFGDRYTRIRTLLGSCIAITFWHPELLVGGMCHYLLPERSARHAWTPSGKYAVEVMDLLLQEIKRTKTNIEEYEIKIFGGGNMYPRLNVCLEEQIGYKNVEVGYRLAKRHGINFKACDTGGKVPRHVIFDIWDGGVWVRKGNSSK